MTIRASNICLAPRVCPSVQIPITGGTDNVLGVALSPRKGQGHIEMLVNNFISFSYFRVNCCLDISLLSSWLMNHYFVENVIYTVFFFKTQTQIYGSQPLYNGYALIFENQSPFCIKRGGMVLAKPQSFPTWLICPSWPPTSVCHAKNTSAPPMSRCMTKSHIPSLGYRAPSSSTSMTHSASPHESACLPLSVARHLATRGYFLMRLTWRSFRLSRSLHSCLSMMPFEENCYVSSKK